MLQKWEKIWFVWLHGERHGPFSFFDLKRMKDVTPDTWAWREGMPSWKQIREIPELKRLFMEEEEEELPAIESKAPEKDLALSMSGGDPPWIVWILLALLLVFYALFLAYHT